MYVVGILLLTLIGLLGAYYYFFSLRILRAINFAGEKHGARKIMATLISIGIMLMVCNNFSISFIFIIHLFIMSILTDIVYMICKKHKYHNENLNKAFNLGVIPIIITCIVVTYGYYNAKNVIKTSYTIESNKLKESEKLKIVMISDVHMGTTMNIDELKLNANKIQKEKPDVVLLVGDIFDERTSLSDVNMTSEVFGHIKSTYGTYFVFGNHEISNKHVGRDYNLQQCKEALEKGNVKILEDSGINMGDRFYLVGRKTNAFIDKVDRKSPKELLQGINSDKYVILMDHRPMDTLENSNNGVDLMLSGHTHAGQLWPVGEVSKILKFDDVNYGHKVINNMELIVSSGFGCWGYPVRTSKHCEYVVIDIHSK